MKSPHVLTYPKTAKYTVHRGERPRTPGQNGKGKGPEARVDWAKLRSNYDGINWGRK